MSLGSFAGLTAHSAVPARERQKTKKSHSSSFVFLRKYPQTSYAGELRWLAKEGP
jgi:hypothetical protein